ncbi:TolB family protein [Streptomyces sp. NPDC088387]|uniref:TolB family protein n=1 Tax=Streptomyces sp. NPDC088387 TaxID=3365859 RepID=UPI0038117ABE
MRAVSVAVVTGAMVALTATATATTTAAAPGPAPRTGTERVTLSATGDQLTGTSDGPRLSADGRYAAFASYAPDAVPGDTNGKSDVFVRDLRGGAVERVTVASDGTQADADSHYVTLSADGRLVAFVSRATNLVPWSSPQTFHSDVYVHDRRTGKTERVSVAADGGSGWVADNLDMSADGRYLAFTAPASRIEGGSAPGHARAYVVDRRTGETRKVSDRLPADWYVSNVRISPDGRHAAYIQRHPRGGRGELYLADLDTGAQRQLNVTPEGEPTNGGPAGLSFSADGSRVAYSSFGDDVVPGAPEGTWELYVHDTRTATTRWITHEGTGGLGGGLLSADGRKLAYMRETTDPDGQSVENVYVRDLGTGRTALVTEARGGGPAGGYSAPSAFTRDGGALALFSTSPDLVPGDTNGEGDGFVRRLR